jgi:hypothetical protein
MDYMVQEFDAAYGQFNKFETLHQAICYANDNAGIRIMAVYFNHSPYGQRLEALVIGGNVFLLTDYDFDSKEPPDTIA